MSEYKFTSFPDRSDWTCYMFGATESDGIRWNPAKGCVPNFFIRWMMNICFGCKWVRKAQEK